MRIVYAAGNRPGATHQLVDFLQHSEHEIKVAGYARLSDALSHFDWTLNPIATNPALVDKLRDDIVNWEPDLVIADCEPIVSQIAATNQLRLVKCSPLHLIDGVRWKRGQQSYTVTIERTREILDRLPKSEYNFIYAPYSYLNPTLKPGFEWIEPYAKCADGASNQVLAVFENKERLKQVERILGPSISNILSRLDKNYEVALSQCSQILTSGETSVIADALANSKIIHVAPDVSDPENVVNALMCAASKIGFDLGQIELLGLLGADDLQKSIELSGHAAQYEPAAKLLHERIDELCP